MENDQLPQAEQPPEVTEPMAVAAAIAEGEQPNIPSERGDDAPPPPPLDAFEKIWRPLSEEETAKVVALKASAQVYFDHLHSIRVNTEAAGRLGHIAEAQQMLRQSVAYAFHAITG